MFIKGILKYLILAILFASCKQTNEQLISKALNLDKGQEHSKAVEIYSEVIRRNKKLQLPYYNRGLCYMHLKKYSKALSDFNRVIDLQSSGGVITIKQEGPFPDAETLSQVPYLDAVYQRAQVKYHMDSIKSSFQDFQLLTDNNFEEKSNCYLWKGVLWLKVGNKTNACNSFNEANKLASTDDDRQEANKMLLNYCR